MNHGKTDAPPSEHVVAGGYDFVKPHAWGQLGAEAAAGDADAEAAGTIVAAVCPAGDDGVRCKGGVQVTFVAYDGKHGKLPLVSTFGDELARALPKAFPGYKPVKSGMLPSADGTRYLRHEFVAGAGVKARREVIGAFRHTDGSGVVVVAAGRPADMKPHVKAIDELLASAADADSPVVSAEH